jgi:hypothetical protein
VSSAEDPQNRDPYEAPHLARNQVYRGTAAAPRAVAKDLGVRYVLEGSVQKSGDHIRVTAQVIDTVNDNHVLSQKYDRNLTDLAAGPPCPRHAFSARTEDHLSEEEAERVLETVINWGRHAEIFAYDYDTEVLSLENF